MHFLKLLAEGSTWFRWRALAYTVAGGVATALIAVIITTVADSNLGETTRFELLIIFLMACVCAIAFNTLAQNLTVELCEGILERLRMRLVELVRRSDLDRLEHIGQTRIYDTIARNVTMISESTPAIVFAATNGIALVLAGLYIVTLSILAFVVITVVFVCLVYSYTFAQRNSREAYIAARGSESGFFGLLGHFLWGFKEVKMSSSRADDLQANHLTTNSKEVELLKIRTGREFNKGAIASYAVFYFLLGTVTFALPQHLPSAQVAMKVVYMVVFMLSTLDACIRGLPILAKVGVALEELETLETDLRKAGHNKETEALNGPSDFTEIEFRAVQFSYRSKDNASTFTLGPCDLTVKKGEVIFFVGGNGSGKSTLLRLITRLYEPETGTILWDGRPVGYDRVSDYRCLFSAVLADFHLFDRLYGYADRDPERVNTLLSTYGLGTVVQYVDGTFTNTDLSSGQKKRLALVVALLEDKPILVLDELAADQDPGFRKRFYEEILPTLNAAGHTILATSHDDRYFGTASRVLEIDNGQFTNIKEVQ